MAKTAVPQVLLVDDEVEVISVFADLLSDSFEVEIASDAETALKRFQAKRFDVVVTDLRMPGRGGVELAREVLDRRPETEVIVMTAYADVDSAIELIRIGAVELLRKPFLIQDLKIAIDRALVQKRVRKSLTEVEVPPRSPQKANQARGLERLFGESLAMVRLRTKVARIQHSNTTILITGRTGAGKEVLARSIHEAGHRGKGPFTAINCAALSRELLESELFGYAKGAFTGAIKDTPGLIEQSGKGTLFLDEIGELPFDLQAKLLRVLQEKSIRRIGEAKVRPVDVRWLAATNRDLEKQVQEGNFREDLYYRLNVFPIRVPSLHRRKKDIPQLAEFLADQIAFEQGLPSRSFSPEVLEALAERSWRGNVRELRNVVERMLLVSEGATLTPSDLELALDLDAVTPSPSTITDPPSRPGTSPGSTPATPSAAIDGLTAESGRPMSLEELEVRYIEKVLQDCGGNKAKAAEILGVHVSTIYRKTQK